jgi:hypothetical protein
MVAFEMSTKKGKKSSVADVRVVRDQAFDAL